jgi:hypothetical protein
MNERRVTLRPGWRPGVGGLVLAAVTGAAIIDAAGSVVAPTGRPMWLVVTGVLAAVVIFAIGLMIGSERVVGFASLPMLAAALESVDVVAGTVSGRSLIVGCLWFVSVESAWSSIERRDDVVRPAAVDRQRLYDVSVIVAVTVIVGLAAALLLPLAPARTLLVRAAILGLVLALMAEAIRRLRLTPDSPISP